VAGDSKQLRPSDFYQVKWESEEEGMEYEAESLLELAAHFFENLQLRGHYRSADPGLIHFSNAHFYGNRLETLPDYATVKAGKTPFSWEKVEGIWENQVNRMEADAVLNRVELIRKEALQDSIGIVTGNYFQMELIRELLWKAGFQDSNLKVRNIENVQGDEFDRVIFCIGYAKNKKGKLIANFGMLSKKGGINRLNVAISRAKKEIIVISSIKPTDFNAGQLKNEGIKLLRDYLNFVIDISKGKAVEIPVQVPHRFESGWSLKDKIEGDHQGFSLEKFPSSAWMDLAVKINGKYREALLTDDQRLYDASSAKEAFVYHPLQLKEKGWPYRFYYSRQYWMDRPILGD
jgi:superfamily I DNA and/or RNA helicase